MKKYNLFFLIFLSVFFTDKNSICNEKNIDEKLLLEFREEKIDSYKLKKSDDYIAYRFIWIRSFDDDMIFRIIMENGNDSPHMIVKKKSKINGKLTISKKYNLRKNDVENIKSLFTNTSFWELPEEINREGFDGALWMLEAIDHGNYHYVSRWAPLPPHNGFIEDPKTLKIIPDPREPKEMQFIYGSEAAFSIFCLYVMFMQPGFDEKIY